MMKRLSTRLDRVHVLLDLAVLLVPVEQLLHVGHDDAVLRIEIADAAGDHLGFLAERLGDDVDHLGRGRLILAVAMGIEESLVPGGAAFGESLEEAPDHIGMLLRDLTAGEGDGALAPAQLVRRPTEQLGIAPSDEGVDVGDGLDTGIDFAAFDRRSDVLVRLQRHNLDAFQRDRNISS